MKLDNEVQNCFGRKDLVFARTPDDQGRAFGWLNSLRKRGVSWDDASAQIAYYLKSRNASDTRIEEQVERAAMFLKPWLEE